ncbi:hypothetical protein MKW94_030387 [Papaver nudicaule]|uniref:Phytocyanin domain-containing protein n=1 Tax=Papaver nudicaule TaxID=74823 RepID=A0AA41VQS2_PAPNU|nr:hypothetical protein [Papaver nudicaule]
MTSNVGMTGFLLVFVTAFALLHHATSETYKVLDPQGWIVPTTGNGDEVYRTWTAGKKFEVDDTLVFNFATGAHDVAKVSKEDFDSCTATNQNSIIRQGPANITLTSSGQHYFICTFGQHCLGGQKLTINVTNDSDTEAPSGSPTTTTPPMTTTPVTPPNSASHTATGSFALALLFISTIFLH